MNRDLEISLKIWVVVLVSFAFYMGANFNPGCADINKHNTEIVKGK